MLLSQVILCPSGFALSDSFSGIGFMGVYAWASQRDGLHSHKSHVGHVTRIKQMLLFTSYQENLDNQFRCRYQLQRWLQFSAEFHCRYASVLPYCSASEFCDLRVPPSGNRTSRVNLHGLVAASILWPWSHGFFNLCVDLLTNLWCLSLIFSGYIWPCSFHSWGFLSQWWIAVIICSEVFAKGDFSKVYVQAQYRKKHIWSACLADLLKHISPLIWKSQSFSFEILACRGKSGPSTADA